MMVLKLLISQGPVSELSIGVCDRIQLFICICLPCVVVGEL